MKDTINKKDLTSGMVVTLRNGSYWHVFADVHFYRPAEKTYSTESVFLNLKTKESHVFGSYDEGFAFRSKGCEDLDIVGIWAPVTFFSAAPQASFLKDHHMIWKRKPDSKPMTIEEIEKELGYPITIIK